MAERALLLIAQAAADELGIQRPTSVVGSTDQQVQQLLALLNREGKELAARDGPNGGWPQLRKEHTITTVASQETYDFPTDLQYFINTTGWDRSVSQLLRGPVSPQEWQFLKSSVAAGAGLRRRFRLMAGKIYLDPIPDVSDEELVIEYYSDTWCASSAAVAQRLWLSDTDVPLLPDDCFVLGLMWRFRKAKGLDYAQEFDTYEKLVTRELSRSGMARVIDLSSGEIDPLTDLTLTYTVLGGETEEGPSWGGGWG